MRDIDLYEFVKCSNTSDWKDIILYKLYHCREKDNEFILETSIFICYTDGSGVRFCYNSIPNVVDSFGLSPVQDMYISRIKVNEDKMFNELRFIPEITDVSFITPRSDEVLNPDRVVDVKVNFIDYDKVYKSLKENDLVKRVIVESPIGLQSRILSI